MYKHIKRLLDFIFSIIGLPFFVILFIVIAPAIVIDDRGSIFYSAFRMGYRGKNFKMLKFRSMKVNSPDLRNADGTTYNSEDDPRVTRVGRILRKTSLDEIPQILNVLVGDMSFVGPRPDLPGADKEIYRPGDRRKLDVRPGITGYSQAYYRNSSTLDERFDGDLYYVENMSFWLDLKILLKTAFTVLTYKNVFRN